MKTVAIVQSNYLPWKGYFDLINSVDEFILYDDAQYTKRDWRNRNQIKSPQGLLWLTVPTEVSGKFHQSIKDTKIADSSFAKNHFLTLQTNYAKTKYFDFFREPLEAILVKKTYVYLSELNFALLTWLCQVLDIKTKLSWSMDYSIQGDQPTEKLLSLCRAAKASHYISGPAAKDYMNLELFAAANMDVKFFEYKNYPEYDQPHPPFTHFVSVLDLLFCVGAEEARQHLQSHSQNNRRSQGALLSEKDRMAK